MPQFKFCFHLESKMSAAAPASSLPWSGPSLHCMRLRRNPPPFFVPLPQLFTWWYGFCFSSRQIPFHIVSFFHLSCLSMIFFFQLEMVCIVWEVCVFAHLPSYWMLLDDCSRLSDVIYALIEYSRLSLYRHQHKAQGKNMLPNCTNLNHSSHVGQTDSNPPWCSQLLTSSQNFKKVCPAMCHWSHQESGRCDQFKV